MPRRSRPWSLAANRLHETEPAVGGSGSGERYIIGKPYDFGELERWIRELPGS